MVTGADSIAHQPYPSRNLDGPNTGRARIKAYLDMLGWLVTDVYRNFKTRFFIIQLWQGLVVILTVIIGGAIFLVLKNFEQGSISFSGLKVTFDQNSNVLWSVFLMIGVLLFLQSYIRYLSEVSVNRVCRLYEEMIVRKALNKLARIRISDLDKLPVPLSRASAMSMVQVEPRFCAMAQRMVLRSLIPFVTLLTASAFLLYINPVVFLGVFTFIIVFAFPAIYLNSRAIGISMDFETLAPRIAMEKRQLLDKIASRPAHEDRSVKDVSNMFSGTEAHRFMDLFEARINIISQSNVAAGSLLAVAVAAITGGLAWQAVQGLMPWSQIIIYFVVLRLIFTSVQRLLSMVTSVNRLFSPINRFHVLMTMQTSPGRVPSMPPGGLTVPVSFSEKHQGAFELKPGKRYFAVSPLPPDRFSIYAMFHELYRNLPANDGRLFDGLTFALFTPVDKDASFRHALELSGHNNLNDLQKIKAIASEVLGHEPNFPNWLDGDYSVNELTEEELYVSRCAALALKSPPVVVLDQRGLVHLSGEQVERLLKQFDSSCLVVHAVKFIRADKTWGIEQAYTHNSKNFTSMLEVDWVVQNRVEIIELTKLPPREKDGVSALIGQDSELI